MANRRLARQNRSKEKKKRKLTKKSSTSELENNNVPLSAGFAGGKKSNLGIKKQKHTVGRQNSQRATLFLLAKKKSGVLKRQATEKMVLKERLRELMDKKNRMRKGENVKVDRRELGKYIRQLKLQLLQKHNDELAELAEEGEASSALLTKKKRCRQLVEPGVPASLYRDQNGCHNEEDQDWVDVNDDAEYSEPILHEDVIEMFSHLTA